MSWKPPSDAIEVTQDTPVESGWTPPADAIAVSPSKDDPKKPETIADLKAEALQGADLKKALIGTAETGLNLATSTAASSVGGLAGLVTAAFSGNAKANEILQQIQEAMTYQPRSEEGQRIVQGIGDIMHGAGQLSSQAAAAAGATGPGAQTIAEATPAVLGTLLMGRGPAKSVATTKYTGTGLPSMGDSVGGVTQALKSPESDMLAVEKASKLIEQNQQFYHRNKAAQDIQDLGLKGNPAVTNPQMGSRAQQSFAGGAEAVDALALEYNTKVGVPRVAKKELGITDEVLTIDSFKKVIADAGAPANKIKRMSSAGLDAEAISALDALRPTNIAGMEKQTAAINKLIDRVQESWRKGLTGEEAIVNIRQYRDTASALFKKTSADEISMARANTYKGLARELENAIERMLERTGDTKLLKEFKDGRAMQAKAYIWRDAFNKDTGLFDVGQIAKQTAGDTFITGDLAKIGNVTNNFPDIVKPKGTVDKRRANAISTHISKTTPPAFLGGAVGGMFGGIPGAGLGAVGGAALGELLAPHAAKSLMSKSSQARLVAPNSSLSSPVSFPPPTPPQPYSPNFTIVPPPAPGPQPTSYPRLPSPSSKASLDALRADEARAGNLSRAVGRAEEAKAAAAEAASRKPTSGELIFDLDPVTGRLREASSGIKGATPETFSNFGLSMESAASKVAAGKKFDLTAAEKVAWDKTKAELSVVSPAFKSISEKEIASKIMDRKWVEEAVTKAKAKAKGLDELSRRAKDADTIRKAVKQREKLMDFVEQMEEGLRQTGK